MLDDSLNSHAAESPLPLKSPLPVQSSHPLISSMFAAFQCQNEFKPIL
jgi:hypothetical protein